MTSTNTQTLADYIRELTRPQPTSLNRRVIKRDDRFLPFPCEYGRLIEIDEELYTWFWRLQPPHYIEGSRFCFTPWLKPFLFLVFVRRGRYYARHLTHDETKRFCELAGIPLPGDG